MPASSRPRATAQTGAPTRRLSQSTTQQGRDREQASTIGELGAGAERGPGVAGQVQLNQVAEDLDVTAGEPVDGRDLGDLVERRTQHARRARRGYGLDRAVRRGRAGLPCVAGAQRRSSRCLHVMHSVARGKAMDRILPIGLPHDSQTP